MAAGPVDPGPQHPTVGRDEGTITYVGQGHLPHPDPGVQHPGVLERIRHQPEAGGVAQAEVAPPGPVESDCGIAALHPGTVLDHVVAQLAEHPGGHELGPVGHPEWMPIRVAGERPHAELPVGVEGGAPQDVSGVAHPVGVGLATGSQLVDQVPEEPDAAVAPGEAQDPRIQPTLLLLGNLDPQPGQQFVIDVTVDQHAGNLPPVGDDPVGVGRLVDRGGEHHEAEPLCSGIHEVDRLAPTLVVEYLVGPAGRPAVGHRPAEHGPAEAVPAETRRAEHVGPHDVRGRPNALGAGGQFHLEYVGPDRAGR